MLKHVFMSSCAALLLIGCTTTATKPVISEQPSPPAKVVHPATKTVKPVLKSNAVVKPKAAPVKVAEQAPANSDAALGKQWASCAGGVEALSMFARDVIKINPSLAESPRMQAQLANFKKFPMVRDSFHAYASAATTPSIAETEMQRVYTQQYTTYKTDFSYLQQTILKGENQHTAASQWLNKYFAQLFDLIKNVSNCELTLAQNYSRFDAHVKPSLQFKQLEGLFNSNPSPVQKAKKSTKKRSHKAA
jgi:hypothetical protein